MFGDPASNPKRWPMASLGALADIQSGLTVSATRHALPRVVPYLRVANVYRGDLDLAEVKSDDVPRERNLQDVASTG